MRWVEEGRGARAGGAGASCADDGGILRGVWLLMLLQYRHGRSSAVLAGGLVSLLCEKI